MKKDDAAIRCCPREVWLGFAQKLDKIMDDALKLSNVLDIAQFEDEDERWKNPELRQVRYAALKDPHSAGEIQRHKGGFS